MRSVQVVVASPLFNDFAGVAIAAEQMLVEAFVPEAPVKALDEAVLHGLSWRDVVPFHTVVLRPFQHGVRGELGSVVADHRQRIATTVGDRIQLSCYTLAGDRVVGDGREAFPAEVVNDAQDAEPAAIDERVRHEVQ